MRSIANADTGSAQSILGSSFYNDVMNASNWNSRTFSSAESTAASNLLTTAAGKSKQDALAYSDVQGYISAGQNLASPTPACWCIMPNCTTAAWALQNGS